MDGVTIEDIEGDTVRVHASRIYPHIFTRAQMSGTEVVHEWTPTQARALASALNAAADAVEGGV
jgi:hypothetical protein